MKRRTGLGHVRMKAIKISNLEYEKKRFRSDWVVENEWRFLTYVLPTTTRMKC